VTAGDATSFPDDAVEVGRIVGAWGVQGGFKVQAFAADPQALFSSRRWFLKAGAARPPGPAPLPGLLRITQAREHGDGIVARAQEVPDRNAAEALKGASIFISRASFPTPDADEFYWVDLIGLAVVNREGVPLGTVADLIDTGPHCVLRVRTEGSAAGDPAAERLIPFVDAYVDQVDLSAHRVTVDWGLDY
jgi:16S rRNA processing protein RimM